MAIDIDDKLPKRFAKTLAKLQDKTILKLLST